jgi:hypothetical protein
MIACRVKLSASKIQSHLLEIRSATWKTYFRSIRAILRSVDQCAKEIKEIQTAMLVSVFAFTIPCFLIRNFPQLIIEAERQRKLTEGIKESQEVLGAVVGSLLRMSPELLWAFISNGIRLSRSRVQSLRIQRPCLPRVIQVCEHLIQHELSELTSLSSV